MMQSIESANQRGVGSMLLVFILLILVVIPDARAQKISLKLNNIDLVEILKTISEQSEYNIAVGPGVSGKVTVYLDSVDVLDAVEIITELSGMAYVVEENTIKVLSRNQYVELYGWTPYDKRKLRVFDLEHVPTGQLVNELAKLKSAKGLILTDTRSNRLFILETLRVMTIMEKVISSADVESDVRVYDLIHVTPESVVPVIQRLLTPAAVTMPDQANNRLILIDRPVNLARAERLILQYDRPSHLQTAAFKLQYGDISELATHVQPMLTLNVGQMITDVANNQVIITDLLEKVEAIGEMISAFDIKTAEVVIEAKIVQVSLTDAHRLGVNWQAFTDKIKEFGTVNISADFNVLSSSDQGLRFSSGLLSEKNYEFALEALGEVGKTDLLSSPHITVLNGKEAKIHVGSSVPYKTIDTREEDGSIRTFEKVTMVDVGVKLNVVATANDSGFIRLQIKTEVSSVTGFSDGIPIVEKTEAETDVLIKDGVTLIIGGLIKDEKRSTVKKIPLLGDIPLLGKLFSSTDDQKIKSELIIFLTPRIITGDVD